MAGINQGLNPKETLELIEYIQKNNSWQNMLDVSKRKRRLIKYYNMSIDTRSGELWKISFRVSGDEPVIFRDSPTFKEDIYKYLDEPINYGKEDKNE